MAFGEPGGLWGKVKWRLAKLAWALIWRGGKVGRWVGWRLLKLYTWLSRKK